MLNYGNMKKRMDNLDGGKSDPNEPVLLVVPKGENPPSNFDPSKHNIIMDWSSSALPAYALSVNQFAALMNEIDGKSRTASLTSPGQLYHVGSSTPDSFRRSRVCIPAM